MEPRRSSGRRILVTGAGGFLGRRIVRNRRAAGDEVVPLVRGGGVPGAVCWNADGTVDRKAVSGFDAVVHLAGEPVGNRRWTAEKKRRIRDSRADGTRNLVEALKAAEQPPGVFVCASGINCYGDCGDAVVDETWPFGTGFLADVCVAWEAEAAKLEPVSRVVELRISVVLDASGGTLALMLPLFRLGLGGPVGGGKAYLSWVTLDDLARAVDHAIASDTLRGPVNVCSPEPVRGREFTTALGAAVGKPAVIPAPAWAVRLLLGQMAEETVLASVRAVPRRLLEDGFVFQHPQLNEALTASGVVPR